MTASAARFPLATHNYRRRRVAVDSVTQNKPSYLRKENVAFTPNDIDSREENENTMSLSQEARVQTNSSEDNIGSVFRRNGWSGVSEELEGLWDLKTARPIHEDDDNNKQFGNENKSSPLQGQRNEQPLDWTNILSMEKPVILVPPYLFGDN